MTEFYSLEENDRQVILAKAEVNYSCSRGPVIFLHRLREESTLVKCAGVKSISCSAEITLIKDRIGVQVPTSWHQVMGGGAAGFDDKCTAQTKEQSTESGTHHQYFTRKKRNKKAKSTF
jgi:hypothetical protein